MNRLALRVAAWLALFIGLWLAPAAAAHEVRPASLDIRQTGPAAYSVIWRQPVVGDLALHLDPHLSTGWLERPADDQYASDTFMVRTWTVRSAKPLEGAVVSVEGLAGTITDVFVRVRLQDGRSQDTMLRPDAPRARLAFAGAAPSNLAAFLVLGAQHILTGPDHLLFVLGLLLLVRDRWMLLKTVTAFTLAHSLTLAAATLGGLGLPVPLLNALIALSILFVAVEVVHSRRGRSTLTTRRPWIVAFGFGLLHGLGFASGLSILGLPRGELLPALALFNVGVEIGQLAFLGLVLALRRSFRLMALDWPAPVRALPEYVIGALGAMWTVQYAAVALGAA